MAQTLLQRSFAPVKKYLPSWIHNPIRSVATAAIGPIHFAYRSGYFRSSFKMAAVSRDGTPLPWYTYPCIDFLTTRQYDEKKVLEFGGGQSTLWWAERAAQVVTLEGDRDWHDELKQRIPNNVALSYVSMESREINVEQVNQVLRDIPNNEFDIIVIDGLYRENMIDIALRLVAEDGMIICDNSEGYGVFEGFKESGLNRVDFSGIAPGVVSPHSTSIYFGPTSFAFSADNIIPNTDAESCD